MSVDLNTDLGESYGRWSLGDDAAMLEVVTSAGRAGIAPLATGRG